MDRIRNMKTISAPIRVFKCCDILKDKKQRLIFYKKNRNGSKESREKVEPKNKTAKKQTQNFTLIDIPVDLFLKLKTNKIKPKTLDSIYKSNQYSNKSNNLDVRI